MVPLPPNATCASHQSSAVATCGRCGAFVCPSCLARRGGRDVCFECTARIDPMAEQAERASMMAWQGLMAAVAVPLVVVVSYVVPWLLALAALVAVAPIVLGVRSLTVNRGTGDRTVAGLAGLSIGCGCLVWAVLSPMFFLLFVWRG